MAAHAIVGSPLWTVRVEPQSARSDAVRESLETCPAEVAFDLKRRAVLDRLGFGPEEPSVTGGNGDPYGLVGVFLRLIELPDEAVLAVVAVVMGETLAAGSAAVEALGEAVALDMSRWWQADEAFFGLVRDREVLTALLAEVAGAKVAEANAKEKGATLKTIIRDCLAGSGGRPKAEGWVPRWMRFPPAAYTARGGVGTLAAHALVEAAKAERPAVPDAGAASAGAGADDDTPPWRVGAEAEPQGGGEAQDGAEIDSPDGPKPGEADPDPDATVERIAA
jgi:ParB family chromosome partitioning protein